MTPTEFRRQQAQRFASQLGLEGESLFEAAMAVWSNLNPQTTSFDTALSAAGVALRAAAAATSPGPAQPDHPARPSGTSGAPGPEVTVVAPDGTQHRFTVTGDDNMTVFVDGEPVLGVDRRGPGRWVGEEWQRLYPADRVVDRSVAIEGITTETQWHDLELAAGLNRGDLGRYKQWAADRPTILFGKHYGARSCDLDAAVEWARQQGLAYEDEQRVRADPAASCFGAGPAMPGPAAAVTDSTTFPNSRGRGPVTSRRRAARTAGAAQQARLRSPQ